MADLVALPKLALLGTFVGLLVGIFGGLCARRQNYRVFVVGIVLLGLAAALLMHAAGGEESSPSRERLVVTSFFLSVAPVVVLFLFVPGLMVRRGASLRAIVATSVATSIVASPFWMLHTIILICRMGIECL